MTGADNGEADGGEDNAYAYDKLSDSQDRNQPTSNYD
eukprot:CAMPEP_0116873370 /NCGR_PEP_ID=MMETSP0463-20121206/4426_1 /TAXON_ID=181622 /ORGANISM="Strombidinopsis sp, Strain SopsisLIS2011" /LENGTH=36 /DNA_ID= /DNA_START= /DNA_END= /DNA_ORIENTATION=